MERFKNHSKLISSNMEKKKIVLPGDHLISNEEAEPSENCYSEKDEIYSSAFGETEIIDMKAKVKAPKTLKSPIQGATVYCMVSRTSTNKALVSCIYESEAEGKGREIVFDAALPVSSIQRDHLRSIRDAVKVGDIIKARIDKVTKTGVDVSIMGSDYGLVAVFCPKCRNRMKQGGNRFLCSCGWFEIRKVPQ